ncbi:MAG TPA: ABC transporter permease [Rectinemataceae bacterium]|nr:ABC transporter permease [Rectinemataceae bacterium]
MSLEVRAHAGAAALMGERRSAKSIAFGTWYVAEHRLRTMRSYLTTILMGSVFNPMIYLFALGVGIGSYIDASAGGIGAGAASYLAFVGPALLSSAALTVAFEESSFPVMGGFKWTREFWAMNATPIGGRQVANGVLLAATFRVVFTVLVFFFFLALFGATPSPWAFLAMPSAILSGIAFGSVIMAIASRLEEDDGWFATIQRLVIAPMFLFSGTFFPLERLPLGLQWIGWISPLWHGTQLGRVASYGMAEPLWLTACHLVFLGAMLALGLALSWKSFERRLAK